MEQVGGIRKGKDGSKAGVETILFSSRGIDLYFLFYFFANNALLGRMNGLVSASGYALSRLRAWECAFEICCTCTLYLLVLMVV